MTFKALLAEAAGQPERPVTGYVAEFSTAAPYLSLAVEDMTDVHYLFQSPTKPVTFIRFKSGDIFSTPGTLDDLVQTLRNREKFGVTPGSIDQDLDIHTATLNLLNRNPGIAMIDLSPFSPSAPVTMILHPATSHRGLSALAPLSECILHPSSSIATITLSHSDYEELRAAFAAESGAQPAATVEGRAVTPG